MAGVGEESGEVRRRKRRKKAKNEGEREAENGERPRESSAPVVAVERKKEEPRQAPESPPRRGLESGSYWLTRIVFIRALGFVYCQSLHSRERGRHSLSLFLSLYSCGISCSTEPE